jgi:hypothetical protein
LGLVFSTDTREILTIGNARTITVPIGGTAIVTLPGGVTYTATSGNTINFSLGTAEGVMLSATPNNGYMFANWNLIDSKTGITETVTQNPYTFATDNSFTDIVVNFIGGGGGSCLLKGTMVKVRGGFQPIETLQTGDIVINHLGKEIQIIQTGQWNYNYKNINEVVLSQIYKIPKGKFGTNTDTYLSKGHRILTKHGNLVIPEKLKLEQAKKEEYCDEGGNYTLYHIKLENCVTNHIVISGNCIVEDWK